MSTDTEILAIGWIYFVALIVFKTKKKKEKKTAYNQLKCLNEQIQQARIRVHNYFLGWVSSIGKLWSGEARTHWFQLPKIGVANFPLLDITYLTNTQIVATLIMQEIQE